jgi:hypothetical protein
MVCGLPPEDYNFTSGCHGDSRTANFLPPVCSCTGEAGKNVQTGFFQSICGLPQAFSRDLRADTKVYNGEQMINFYLFTGSEGEFFKNRSLLKEQSHKKFGEMRVWGISLGQN